MTNKVSIDNSNKETAKLKPEQIIEFAFGNIEGQ